MHHLAVEIAPPLSGGQQQSLVIVIGIVAQDVAGPEGYTGQQLVEAAVRGGGAEQLDGDVPDVHRLAGIHFYRYLPGRFRPLHVDGDLGAVIAQRLQASPDLFTRRGDKTDALPGRIRGFTEPGEGVALQFALEPDDGVLQRARERVERQLQTGQEDQAGAGAQLTTVHAAGTVAVTPGARSPRS